ncbi:MAG: hypothetical protein SOZ53_01810 [Candidatus Onthovivens sp.]|nr:hypothetical protein [Candidatus Onthovivens sp.]
MNEFLIRKMNMEFEEDKIRKDNISLKDKILEKAKTYKELQMIYGKIDKEVVVCKCCRDFINELEENDLSMDFIRKLVNSIWCL